MKPKSIISAVRMVNKVLTKVSPRVNKLYHKHLKEDTGLTLAELINQTLENNDNPGSYFMFDETLITPESKRYAMDAVLLLDWGNPPLDYGGQILKKAQHIGGVLTHKQSYWSLVYYIISQTQV